MKKLLALVPVLFLAGCNTPELIKPEYKVVEVPDSMFECPIDRKFPRWQTLNDVEVAKTIVRLYKNNRTCKASLDAVQKFLIDAKVKIEGE
jgi:hypothetical protein